MAERIKKEDVARQLATRMDTDEATATAWVDGVVETLYEAFKAGESVTLPGFGGFLSAPSRKAGFSSSIQASACARCLVGHRSTLVNSKRTEQ